MKYKTSELTGDLLDAAVAMAEGRLVLEDEPGWAKGDYLALRDEYGGQHVVRWYSGSGELGGWEPLCNQGSPSTRWEDGGPIIDRERISLHATHIEDWRAWIDPDGVKARGDTALIAACRAFVAHKLGKEVEL